MKILAKHPLTQLGLLVGRLEVDRAKRNGLSLEL
jgi:hypothetical protein